MISEEAKVGLVKQAIRSSIMLAKRSSQENRKVVQKLENFTPITVIDVRSDSSVLCPARTLESSDSFISTGNTVYMITKSAQSIPHTKCSNRRDNST